MRFLSNMKTKRKPGGDMSQKYYRPYNSDSESDSGSDAGSDSASDSSSGSDTSSLLELPQNKFQQFLAGSISLNKEEDRRKYENPGLQYSYVDSTVSGAGSGTAQEIVDTAKLPEPKFETNKNTTLIMINSRDRDTTIYTQPTDFYIRLPRTYKSITNIAITQLKLLSSFYYFSPTKNNISLSILELGRARTENNVDVSNVIISSIRQGTYDAISLVNELNIQLNKTPLFADISGGKGAFLARFQIGGDYTELFNQPGDNTYNSLTGTYSSGLTKADIIARYFYSASTSLTNQFYSGDEATVAYYYPILKEMMLDPAQINLLTLNTPALLAATTSGTTVNSSDSINSTGEQPFDRIVYGFRGLSDVYVTAVVNLPANQTVMDNYRQLNTYTYFLANKYTCSYDTTVGRFKIIAPSINTSINSDLNFVYSNALIKQITSGSNTTSQYATLQASVTNQNAAIGDFYSFIHQNITNSFAIDYGKFTRTFLANIENEISTYDASGIVGLYATQLSANIVNKQIDTSIVLPADISGTWPLLTSNLTMFEDYSTLIPKDTNGYIDISNSSEYLAGYVDIPFTVNPICYSQFKFKSRCRQTMSYMTLPRTQEQKEVIDASESYILPPRLFDSNGICLLDPSIQANPTFYMFDISQSMFETSESMLYNDKYLRYIRQQKPILTNTVQVADVIIPDNRSRIFFELHTDKYEQAVDVSNYMFDVKFRIDAEANRTFPVDFDVYMYRDRAAFMYDVSNALVAGTLLKPRPKNYFTKYSATAGSPYLEIDLRVIGNNTYYFYLHTRADNYGQFIIKPYCTLFSPYGTRYPVTNDLAFRKMPYLSSVTNRSPAIYTNQFYTYDLSANYIAGYDSNKVSNDYLDYLIRTADTETGYDPNNAATYSFKKLGPSSSNVGSNITTRDKSLWFYSNSSNYITNVSTNNIYLSPSNVSSFNLASTATTTFKIINSFIANDVKNPEMIIIPREQTNTVYSNAAPIISSITTFPVTSTIVNSQSVYTSTAKISYSTVGLSYSSITNTFNGSFDSNINWDSVAKPNVVGSPLYLCDNPSAITYDCSYNPLPPDFIPPPSDTNTLSFGTDASGVTGFTFQTPYDKFCSIQEFVIKFAYINPTFTATPYLQNGLNDPSIDLQYYNTRVKYLKIYRTADIVDIDPTDISGVIQPLMTLQRSKIVQIGQFTPALPGQLEPLRNRNPEWGTYYTYEIVGTPPPLRPFPILYNPYVDASGNQPPAPLENTYSAIPVNEDGTLGAFYALSFTKQLFKYKSTDANLLVNYQYNYLLTKRNTPQQQTNPTDFKIQLLAPNNPPIHLITKISYVNPARTSAVTLSDPALDISRFGDGTITGISGELADTQIFLYDDSISRSQSVISNDVRYGTSRISDYNKTSVNDSAVWGQEKGTVYKARDDDSGYNFLSYIHDAVIRKNSSNVMNIRGYVPTAKLTSGLRIIGRNWTDYGVATLKEIMEDLDTLVGGNPAMSINSNGNIINEYVRYTNGNYYSRNYALGLIRFNNSFKVKKSFGLGLGSATYLGETFDGTAVSNAFRAALTQYVTLYNNIQTNQLTVNSAATNALTSLTNYVNIRYQGILPTSFLKRSRLSDPIPFQIRFKSSLIAPYLTAFDEWGLGWNLGFDKIDTTFATQQTATTFIRIIDDYIYLKMNNEVDMNTIDISEKEYLNRSQDTFGQSSRYFAKLLLNTFGNFSQTYIQAPKIFNPVLGKLDKFHFQWVDRFGNVINNNDCEFNITLQVEESIDQLQKSSTLDTGVNNLVAKISAAPK